jgi:hypothetical protein
VFYIKYFDYHCIMLFKSLLKKLNPNKSCTTMWRATSLQWILLHVTIKLFYTRQNVVTRTSIHCNDSICCADCNCVIDITIKGCKSLSFKKKESLHKLTMSKDCKNSPTKMPCKATTSNHHCHCLLCNNQSYVVNVALAIARKSLS